MALLVLLGALAVQGWRLSKQVQTLRQDVAAARASVMESGPLAQAPPTEQRARLRDVVQTLQNDAGQLRATTSSWPWRLGRRLPGLSGSLSTVDEIAIASDTVAGGVLPVLADIAADLRTGPRAGPLDLTAITGRREALQDAQREVARTRERLTAADVTNPVVRRAHGEVLGQLTTLESALRPLVSVARVGGAMTGEQGRRRYLVVLQSPAESRATGGLVGGYLQLDVRDGAVTIVQTGSNRQLDSRRDRDVVQVGGGFDSVWGPFGAKRAWFASNLSLDFPSAATVWAALYQDQYGVPIDGLVGVTPEAVGQLLSAIGPLTLSDGTLLTADSAASFLEVGLYRRFPRPSDEPARDAFQLGVLRSLAAAVLRSQPLSPRYLDAFHKSTAQGSIRLASSRPDEQGEIAGTALAGALPADRRPFVAWSSQNIAGTKLDVYLRRQLRYVRTPLAGGRERVVATARLRNDAPRTGLPPYVTYRADLDTAQRSRAVPGSNKLLVATYLSHGAKVTSVRLDGQSVIYRPGVEQGHPVVLVDVPLAPGGGTAEVEVAAEQPALPGPVQTLRQPMTRPDDILLP